MKFKIILSTVLITVLTSSFVFAQNQITEQSAQNYTTFKYIGERAALMKDVSAYKWIMATTTHQQPTAYSAKQEVSVLSSSKKLAKKNNLNTESVLIFAQVQMNISKQIETYWFNYWDNPNTPTSEKPNQKSIKSLSTLRQEISSIDNKLYPNIKTHIHRIHHASFTTFKQYFITDQDSPIKGIPENPSYLKMLFKSLENIKQN